ncbi:DUF1697 domain-containing protein [Conexibacter arvalis]|uniref:Uncharacterized protein (DUF1697 family) n=1 Tax=Conexibacter arvalis TaxID=912552 RepID=A0A840IBY8_9ACTN|nr:DUF1697 domain-containing protein [Conexibacter arvalis]MBB4662346.1 uncharacterized protein (DUF1697 family) [Conexibacter arvalis]
MPARRIALLRGINVGGGKKVPMAQLRELVEGLGHTAVRTYVQSGNVVFTAADPDAAAAEVGEGIERAIAAAFGFDVLVTIRTRDELAAVIAADPFAGVADHPSRYHVLFLAEAGDPRRLEELDRAAYEPERFALRGRELYLWTPEGLGRSKLAQALSERRLGVAATARNWRTVTTLLALADAAE